MICLEKDNVKVSTNNEEAATKFEEYGYTRIEGWHRLTPVLRKAAKETILWFVLPVLIGLGVFYLSGGQVYTAFVLGAYVACAVSRLSR